MNKIRKEILEVIEDTKKQTSHPEEFLEFLLEGIMEITEEHSKESFYAGRNEDYIGWNEYEPDDWKKWYDEEMKV